MKWQKSKIIKLLTVSPVALTPLLANSCQKQSDQTQVVLGNNLNEYIQKTLESLVGNNANFSFQSTGDKISEVGFYKPDSYDLKTKKGTKYDNNNAGAFILKYGTKTISGDETTYSLNSNQLHNNPVILGTLVLKTNEKTPRYFVENLAVTFSVTVTNSNNPEITASEYNVDPITTFTEIVTNQANLQINDTSVTNKDDLATLKAFFASGNKNITNYLFNSQSPKASLTPTANGTIVKTNYESTKSDPKTITFPKGTKLLSNKPALNENYAIEYQTNFYSDYFIIMTTSALKFSKINASI